MTFFIPGKIVKTFKTKKDEEAVIRYPKWEDLDEMVKFINIISQEDTFTTFSGEVIYKDGEMHYLTEMIKGMEQKSSIYLVCFVGNVMVGSVSVSRDYVHRKRSYHVGVFGITIAANYRGLGIGEEMSKVVIEEAKRHMDGLKIFTLNVYSPNEIAINLYKKLGFVQCGRIPKSIWYRGEYVDEIKMSRDAGK